MLYLFSTYLACRARLYIAEAIGAEAEVPVNFLIQPPFVLVVFKIIERKRYLMLIIKNYITNVIGLKVIK